jgi:GT2 family glycosyltransferase
MAQWKPIVRFSKEVAPIDGPRISLLMPVYNTPAAVLDAAIRSVLAQTYPNWELCICDDASTDDACLAMLDDWKGFDPRLKISRSKVNLGIAEATNHAANFASGEFIGFLDHDDMLTSDALGCFATAIAQHPDADLLYSDEDKIEEDGSRSEPYLKPDWSPEHLLSVPYILHLMVVRTSLFLSLDGLRGAYSGAQDYDLSLRATAAARRVVHIPHICYHWRKIPGSAAAQVDAKPEALKRGEAALRDFVSTRHAAATVQPGLFQGSFRARWPVDDQVPVTLLILTGCRRRNVPGRGDILLIEHAVRSILARSTLQNYRILVLNDGDMPTVSRDFMAAAGVRVIDHDRIRPFNYPAKLNLGVTFVETEDLIILNDDIEVISPDWMEALLEHSRRPEVGVVGARLLYPNGRIQHAGIALGVCGPTAHLFHNMPADHVGYNGFTHVVRNYSAVTGAVMATRTSLFREIGGYDEALAIDYNDVDFCLRLGAGGLRCVWTPFATLYHFEGSSISRTAPSDADQMLFVKRWGHLFGADPFYNPGLPGDRLDCFVSS